MFSDASLILDHSVRICSTVLTQPGTPVSFRGMFIYSLFDFRKLRIFQCFPFLENSGTPMFLISRNSGLRRFPIFSYYVITLISCLYLSLVTPSAVVSTSLSPDPQFPSTLPYCLAYVTQFPLLCTGTTLVHSLVISTCILYLDHQNQDYYSSPTRLICPLLDLLTCYLFSGSGNSHAHSNSEIRDP